ncbi:MAG: response regulator [Saprospiraceae bacterium]|nr:response regulator [Saprospiraceae bacterium]
MNTRQTTHILLIEDNPGDAQLVKIYMKDAAFKYELFVAETLFEGQDIIGRQEIDIVLLDLSLPDTQGFKTLNLYLEKVPNIPVIVLTGVNNEIVGYQAVKAGAQDYLVKGQFEGKLLGRSIRYAVQRHKEVQKLEETKRELTINERRIVKAQQLAGFGNWEMDLVSSEMFWTDEIYRIFGFHPGSISTGLSDYINYVHYEDRDMVEQFFDNAMKDGKLYKIEHRIVVDGTSIKWLAIHAQVFCDDLTNRTMLVGGVQDITERKANEQMIMEQNINRQTSLLKDEAMQDMSFHIRTPLSSVVNLLYLLETTTISPQQRELVEGLKISVEDLSLNINNMLNFSMLVSQNLKPEDADIAIGDFINSLKKVIQIKADKAKVKLEFSMGDSLPEKIIGDDKKITQIIYNLIDHATRHTPSGNRIVMSLDIINNDKLNIRASYTGKTLTINQIKELTEENKILETIKNDANETDKQQLSLAIVSKLVKILKGNFNIANKDSDSTLFDVIIPIKAVKIQQLNATAPEEPVKILLVEDHFLNQMATKKLLTSWSPLVTVDIAENGMIAVEKFKAHGYDLILMDLQMPTMNGFDATVRIREKSQVPIIALTASASKQEAERCFQIGMNNYVSKPFKPNELYMVIMSALASVVESV